ncbi:MAG TPA: deoxyribodipyrimidine photo-lyase [Alphaproteobacteria bacterium]|nr:deoxyribodipyrimidine photo-lyase [Alphaproteobacteria bacterium]
MSSPDAPSLVWFRQDLRLADNDALIAAAERGAPMAAVYVLDDKAPGAWKTGGAARWWLHHSLAALGADLKKRGIQLILARGEAETLVPQTAVRMAAGAVYWNRCYEPFAVDRDTTIKAALKAEGIAARSFGASLLAEPWTVKTQASGPFKVFTPFWNALKARMPPSRPRPAPAIGQNMTNIASEDLASWNLLPVKPDWAKAFAEQWTPGEAGAQKRLTGFLEQGLDDYRTGRDLPGIDGVSRMSPHLHWGEISVRQLWHAADARGGPEAEPYLRELGWRDFAHHLLWHFPELPQKPFSAKFVEFPWREDKPALKAWQRGMTGYPYIDAGMRQLWTTGWMHNRVRMAAASFLVKHLLIPWQEGEAWFWDTLVDADLANNAMNWQWVAGCGADAAPYFRIFNPVTQGEKFDVDGAYVRRWVPEVAKLPGNFLHRPWEAPADLLADAEIVLGQTYPRPIVDHAAARSRALAALAQTRG